jgi:aldehyde dehydrogenase (NAD(P)+)
MGATDRGRLLLKLADLIEENKEILAAADAWDNGKFLNINTNNGIADYVRQAVQRGIGGRCG